MEQPNEAQLEWIQMRKDFNEDHNETAREKFMRKFKQNPLVPIGEFCLVFGMLIIIIESIDH